MKAEQREARRSEAVERSRNAKERRAMCVADEMIGLRRVRLYRDGLVQVGGTFGGGRLERLVRLSVHNDTQQKSSLGRLAAGIATGGNNAFLSGLKGDLNVIVTTKADTYVLHQEQPTQAIVRGAYTLNAVAQTIVNN